MGVPELVERVVASGGLSEVQDNDLDEIAAVLQEEEVREFSARLITSSAKGFGYYVTNVLSLGARGRIEHAQEQYLDCLRLLIAMDLVTRKGRLTLKEVTDGLTHLKIGCAKRLKLLSKLRRGLSGKNRGGFEEKTPFGIPKVELERIDSTINAGDIAWNAVKGASSGFSLAATTWSLVGTFGVASTGTPIATLSGAAATKATLAWLGWGSLATGGMGTAGGTLVLGGIVAIPAVFLYGAFCHLNAWKAVKQIEEKTNEIIEQLDARKSMQTMIVVLGNRSIELIDALQHSEKAFLCVFRKAYRELYPLGPLTRLRRFLGNAIFGKPYFTLNEYEKIRGVISIAHEFAKIIDQPLMNENGSVVEQDVQKLEAE
ncbi:MAG: hypothetical protein H3C30_08825 [Candidatus Hydrogenedentes bacterium]|nr:hypothetical protein [Candidatus Hydrogenedentota bacterium]